jgi:1-deoxy-D-xylulose-5-phosphate reductoisomerase
VAIAEGAARTDTVLGSTRTVSVLGSTGSVGRSTVDLLAANPAAFRVRALVGNRNARLLAEQARTLRAELAVCADPAMHEDLRAALAGSGVAIACGRQAVLDAARLGADWTMAAITGLAGLAPTLAAAEAGRTVALANKEALVSAGDVMLRAVAAAGATLLPVDSEHNAIFQALAGTPRNALEKIVLTASGGPFRLSSREEMAVAGPEAALRHPVWSMGAKISIDSATLFNKGLEVIEAARLFGLAEHEIEVLVHPQSIVHGLVYFTDGSVLPTRWPGRRGCTPPPRGSIWPRPPGWNSRRLITFAFPPCAWRARPCGRAAGHPRYSTRPTRSLWRLSCKGASGSWISPPSWNRCWTGWGRVTRIRWRR